MERQSILVITDRAEKGARFKALNHDYLVVYLMNRSKLFYHIKTQPVDFIVFHTLKVDSVHTIIENESDLSIDHIPVLWYPDEEAISYESVLACYNKGIGYVSGSNVTEELLIAKVTGILKAEKKKALRLRRSLVMENANTPINEDESNFVERLNSYLVLNNLKSDFCIEKMGCDLGMSRTNFYSKIKSVTGMSPSRLVMQYRLNMACALLKTDATNVSDVAYQVGFTSAAYFSKCFKEHFQMKPTEYKTNQEQIPFDNRVVTSFKFA